MITQTGIRRPDVDDGYIGLGTRVRYHHLACEVRLTKEKFPTGLNWGAMDAPFERQWVSTGVRKGFNVSGFDRAFAADQESPFAFGGPHTFKGTSNKTLAIWPEQGEAIVVSLIRKGIGESVAGYESGYETPEWEPGYFVAKEWAWLYVLKPSMVGMTDFLLAPMDAVRAVS